MQVTCEQRFRSPVREEGTTCSAKLLYQITGIPCDQESQALALLIATSPADYDGLLRQQISGFQPVGPEIWTADVLYGEASKDEGTWEYIFDGSGATQHISTSLGTRSRTAITGTAADFGGAIGVTDNGVEGCDIVVPKYSFSIAYRFASNFVTPAYAAMCAVLVGKTNLSIFKGFAAGTVLYQGPGGRFAGSILPSGRARTVEITHRFDVSPHVNLTIGGKNIQKYGWDYLWTRYIQKKDDASKSRILYPQAVYVEKVYEQIDFGALGIGS